MISSRWGTCSCISIWGPCHGKGSEPLTRNRSTRKSARRNSAPQLTCCVKAILVRQVSSYFLFILFFHSFRWLKFGLAAPISQYRRVHTKEVTAALNFSLQYFHLLHMMEFCASSAASWHLSSYILAQNSATSYQNIAHIRSFKLI